MGSPKALLKMPDGETFLDRLIRLLGRRCAPVIAVLGYDAAQVRSGLARASEAAIVENPQHAEGQLSSLQCGLRAVPAEAAGVLFTLVDLPAIRPATIDALADAFSTGGHLLAIPRHAGARGHPVCCARELVGEFLALPPGAQAREVIHRHRERTLYVDVDDPGILRDIDDRAAYLDLARAEAL